MPWDEESDSKTDEEQIEELGKMDLDLPKGELLKLVKRYSVLSGIENPDDMSQDDLWNAIDDIVDP